MPEERIETTIIKKIYNSKNELHCEDGPAVIWSNGQKEWYQNGKRHREDGPAIIWSDGTEEYWLNGKRHRLDGPAIICRNGGRYWYRNGKKHRLDGPAEYSICSPDSYQLWYRNGKRHRTDGPAEIWPSSKRYWLNGKKLIEEEFFEKMNSFTH